MKTILSALSLLCLVSLTAFGAVPSYEKFLGTNGIVIKTNPPNGAVIVDGAALSNGVSSTFITMINSVSNFFDNASTTIIQFTSNYFYNANSILTTTIYQVGANDTNYVNAAIAAKGTNYPPVIPMGTNVTVGSGIRQSLTIQTNASFKIVFTGTPLNGEHVSIAVSNTSASPIYMTNAPGIYDAAVASNVTTFAIPGSSVKFFEFVSSTNFNLGVARWELRDFLGKEVELAVASPGLAMHTNPANSIITISNSYILANGNLFVPAGIVQTNNGQTVSITNGSIGAGTAVSTTPGTVTASNVWDASNVKYWGAVGDGVTDDTMALTAAFNAMTNNGSIVINELCLITSEIQIANKTNLLIKGTGGFTSTCSVRTISFTNCDNLTISGLRFIGRTNLTTQMLLNLQGINGGLIDHCTFKNAGYTAINNNDPNVVVNRLTISSCEFDYCGDFGVLINKPKNCIVSGNHFKTFPGVNYPSHAVYLVYNVQHCYVLNNYIEDVTKANSSAINLSGQSNSWDNVISGNTITNCVTGISFESMHNTDVSGNTIAGMSQFGIDFYTSNHLATVRGNRLISIGTTGIRAIGSGINYISEVNIFGNTMENVTSKAFDFENVYGGRVHGNLVKGTPTSVYIATTCTNLVIESILGTYADGSALIEGVATAKGVSAVDGTLGNNGATQITAQGGQGAYGAGISFTSKRSDAPFAVAEQAKIVASGTGGWNSSGQVSSRLGFFTVKANSLTEKVVIDESGMVGIGTNAPGKTLDVMGTMMTHGLASNASPISLLGRLATGEIVETETVSGGGGGLTTNANQFTGVPLSIPANAKLTNIYNYGLYDKTIATGARVMVSEATPTGQIIEGAVTTIELGTLAGIGSTALTIQLSNQVRVAAGANITVTPSGAGGVMTYTVAGTASGGTNYPPVIRIGTNVAVGVGVRQDLTLQTNASFAIVFTGTPLNGENVRVGVSNTSTSVIYMTNTAGIYDPTVASNVTTFAIAGTSARFFAFTSSTNFNLGVARWELRSALGKEMELAVSSPGLVMITNAEKSIITISNSALNPPTNTAPSLKVVPANLHNIAIGSGWTNDMGARADLVIVLSQTDAATGDPGIMVTNITDVSGITKTLTGGLVQTHQEPIYLLDVNPNDTGTIVDLTTGTGSAQSIKFAYWKLK